MCRVTYLVLELVCLLASIGPAISAPSPGTVSFTFEKRRAGLQDVSGLYRRQPKTVTASLSNLDILYVINVTVGTPGQSLSLQLDTGSSDLWFPSAQAEICQQQLTNCPYGTYDASESSTYLNLDTNVPAFGIQYSDGSQVSGVYLSDNLNIGETQLTNVTMAAATTLNTTRAIGVMGVGFASGESAAEADDFTYPTVINVLKNEGLINVLAYSLWLNDPDANTGSILFGGVDTEKYHGDLISLPIQLDSQTGIIDSFTVAWTGLTITTGAKISDLSPSAPQPAILDSGTTDTLLPDDVVNNIFNGIGVVTDPQYGNVVPCSIAGDNLTFAFQFGGKGGPMINASLSRFVTTLVTTDGSQPTFANGEVACSFAIGSAGANPIIFGDSFLHNAYVVYDLDNQQIGLAQAILNSSTDKTNVQAFSVGGGIPNVVSTASMASVAQTVGTQTSETAPTNGATSRSATFQLTPITTGSGSSTTSTASGTAPPGSSSGSSSSSGVKIGIGVAVPVGVILIAVVLGIFLIRRRRGVRSKERQKQASQRDDGHAEEVQEGPEHLETYHRKPELEAEPVIDPTIRGPVKRKFELRSQGTMETRAMDDSRAPDMVEIPDTNTPWSHEPRDHMPQELPPNQTSEIMTGSLTEQRMKQLKQQAMDSNTSTSTSTAVPSSSDRLLNQNLSTEESELAEEADLIVQELGLLSLRRRALMTQASAVGKVPADVEGRKGEEYRELVEREARLKRRLDEIEHQRQG
ncbi:uncharacterized protein Z520_09930 [Fonsecaea multimorphosa CBS 102226]|uniref:Peptidase A1 domain-containing protein n=1 Tax=Fonsecaea multimorphosa CBS 102226 TaxID=1442371 RepID=A0A0D2GXC0_9EURO|nr:uncharacterized protein Z520_09930 [Fonsecaea multimorphosa CBS 102226]KIX94220.1 hypothetical protein Z520_09930 [Fonsecaea multimorphosa CBS 102226]OAL19903.1 hypothetical protein AYO22_09430 [Fonsecaea multimorphosa]